MIMKLRRRFLTKWGGRLNSAAAKADIKHFASVVGWPIELPEAMLDLLVLLVIPPDPLHCCLLGRLNFIIELNQIILHGLSKHRHMNNSLLVQPKSKVLK